MLYSLAKFLKDLHRFELLIGLLITLVSLALVYSWRGELDFRRTLPLGMSWIGMAFLVDYLNVKINHTSYIPINKQRYAQVLRIIIVTISFNAMSDIFYMIFTRMWYYPFYSARQHLMLAPLGYFVFGFVLFSLYELIRKAFASKKGALSLKLRKVYQYLINFEFILGIIGLIASMIYGLQIMNQFSIPILKFSESSHIETAWWFSFIVFISIFFIFEYIAYRQEKITLSYDLFKGNLLPVMAIAFGCIVGIVFFEYINLPLGVWVFDNWPLHSHRFLGLPVFTYIFWPTQFFALLSMMRVAFDSDEIVIW